MRRSAWTCIDCGRSTRALGEYYMLTSECWSALGDPSGMLCIADVERRLGRSLTEADFERHAPVNQDPRARRSPQLSDRLGSVVWSVDAWVKRPRAKPITQSPKK